MEESGLSKDYLHILLSKISKTEENNVNITQLREWLKEGRVSGENNELDFKEKWIEVPKLAKLILAIANYGGGSIIIGVKEEKDYCVPIGIENFEDKTDIIQKLEALLPSVLISQIDIRNYYYEESEYPALKGKKFQVLTIRPNNKDLPYLGSKEQEKLHKNRIYIRRGASNEEANNDEINEILTKKLEALYGEKKKLDLEVHIEQLKELYLHIPRTKYERVEGTVESIGKRLEKSFNKVLGYHQEVNNDYYPELEFEEFISQCISDKQNRIRYELDI